MSASAPWEVAAFHERAPAAAREVFPAGIVEPVRAPVRRGPRIGLALGGGSARGWAHIGVIEGLEEAGIYPEVVAGCSIGAVVGGCYAAGKLDVLTAFARSLTKRRVMGLLDVRLSGSGIIGGRRLRKHLERDLAGRDLDSLPIRFASVATELGTGHEVWLTRGALVESLRASYALPGIFPPVALGGRLLMDGTLVNPVPVSLARALGAEMVICVNLNCDPRVRSGRVIEPEDETLAAIASEVVEERRWRFLRAMGGGRFLSSRRDEGPRAPGIGRVMFDAFNITQDRISRARLEQHPPDVAIAPKLADMGQFEFHRAGEAIALGRQAARAALPRIRAALEGAEARA